MKASSTHPNFYAFEHTLAYIYVKSQKHIQNCTGKLGPVRKTVFVSGETRASTKSFDAIMKATKDRMSTPASAVIKTEIASGKIKVVKVSAQKLAALSDADVVGMSMFVSSEAAAVLYGQDNSSRAFAQICLPDPFCVLHKALGVPESLVMDVKEEFTIERLHRAMKGQFIKTAQNTLMSILVSIDSTLLEAFPIFDGSGGCLVAKAIQLEEDAGPEPAYYVAFPLKWALDAMATIAKDASELAKISDDDVLYLPKNKEWDEAPGVVVSTIEPPAKVEQEPK